MVSNVQFPKHPLSFPEVKEVPHREHKAYKVRSKIFVTHNAKEN